MVWLDRTGLFLQFCAFWFVAPEILGRSGVHRLRSVLTTFIRFALLLPVGIGFVLIVWTLMFRELAEKLHNWHRALGLSSSVLIVLFALLRFYRSERLKTILDEIEDDEAFRRRLLSWGIVCFSLGFILQFAATF